MFFPSFWKSWRVQKGPGGWQEEVPSVVFQIRLDDAEEAQNNHYLSDSAKGFARSLKGKVQVINSRILSIKNRTWGKANQDVNCSMPLSLSIVGLSYFLALMHFLIGFIIHMIMGFKGLFFMFIHLLYLPNPTEVLQTSYQTSLDKSGKNRPNSKHTNLQNNPGRAILSAYGRFRIPDLRFFLRD